MRRSLALASVALLALPIAHPALADTAMSIGVYLWHSPDEDPVKAQFLSIADGNAETEIDGPEGTKSDSHKATPDEITQLTAAVKEQMSALSMDTKPQPAGGYVTVDWHFSTDTSYADGSTTFALDGVPASILTLQQTAFGATFAK
jgi:hypothetical protein